MFTKRDLAILAFWGTQPYREWDPTTPWRNEGGPRFTVRKSTGIYSPSVPYIKISLRSKPVHYFYKLLDFLKSKFSKPRGVITEITVAGRSRKHSLDPLRYYYK